VSGRPPDHPTQPRPPVRRGAVRPSLPRSRGLRLWRAAILAVLGIGLLALCVTVLGTLGYFYVASQLPPPESLAQRSFTFASTRIYDRNGDLIWELMAPTAGRRTWMPLNRISPLLVAATIATEDRFFYANVGVDPIAVVRALYYAITEGEVVSGGSTITQQVARNVLLSPEERGEKTLARKIREAVLAIEIARRYPKDKILEIYLNQIYYGNLAYGIEAASQTYFGKPASDLTLAEASLLAGLPQAPAVYDPIANPDAAKKRQQVVLGLMVEAGYITPAEATAAFQEYLEYTPPPLEFDAPHFIMYVRQLLETRYGPDLLYHEPGLQVHTTLDPRIQAVAEEEVRQQVAALGNRNVSSGAVVVLDVKTGEILAMVGSKDFNDEAISGQVNMAVRPRQPGSAIKPLTYLAAFERGWTPATLLMDVPVEYPDGAGGVYRPRNYDGKFRGPVLLRYALANSLNIPAVKTLEFVGVPALKEMARRLGITTLTRDDYGLALTLGGGEVSLLELTGAYQALANGGLRVPPVAFLRITDGLGRLIEEYRPPAGDPVLRPEHAYLITHILADNAARTPLFGANSPLRLSRPAAAKTGTTNDFRDSWTVGYTPDIVVGVWVGNADNQPMRDMSGLAGAAPIWHNVIERSLADRPVRDFIRPPAVVTMEICADSGTVPSSECPQRTSELFAQDQPPLGAEHDMHQRLRIDVRNGCVLAPGAVAEQVEERVFVVYPPDGLAWAAEHGIEQPPPPCAAPPTPPIPPTAPPPPAAAGPIAAITWPADGQSVEGVIVIQGVALAAGFSHYVVEVGVGWSPDAYWPLTGPVTEAVEGGRLVEWDTRAQPNGPYTLRLVVFDRSGGQQEARAAVVVNNPLPATPTSALPWEEPDAPIIIPPELLTPTPPPDFEPITPAPTFEPMTPTPTVPVALPPTETWLPPPEPSPTPTATEEFLPPPPPDAGPEATPTPPVVMPIPTV
jgi:1A family penicillin-binding protein